VVNNKRKWLIKNGNNPNMKGYNMKRIMTRLLFAAVVAFVLSAGCEKKEAINTRQARLVGAQNLQLKQEIQKLKTQLETRKNTYQKELLKQKKVVNDLKNQNEDLRARFNTEFGDKINDMMVSMAGSFGEQNERLQEENKQLKKQIEELKNK